MVDVVTSYSEKDNCYVCPLCHHRLRELENDSVEDSAETMQEKIKTQVNTSVEGIHADLISTLELLKGQPIHPIHPQESIETLLKEEYKSVLKIFRRDV